MQEKMLRIKDITIDERLYPREKVNQTVVNTYARAMKDGDIFPLPLVADFKGKCIMVDGRHRLQALEVNGEEYVRCKIQKNLPDKAALYMAAIKSNLKHGARLTTADREKIAYTMKDMGYDIKDVSKLLHIKMDKIEKGISYKAKQIIFGKKVKEGKLRGVISEKVKAEELVPITDKVTEQIETLEGIYDYLKSEKLKLENKRIVSLVKKIGNKIGRLLKRINYGGR